MWRALAVVSPVAFRFVNGLFIISSFVWLLVVLSGQESCGVSSFFSFYSLSLHSVCIMAV